MKMDTQKFTNLDFLMHIDIIAVTIQSNKIVSSEVKDTKHYLWAIIGKKTKWTFGQPSSFLEAWKTFRSSETAGGSTSMWQGGLPTLRCPSIEGNGNHLVNLCLLAPCFHLHFFHFCFCTPFPASSASSCLGASCPQRCFPWTTLAFTCFVAKAKQWKARKHGLWWPRSRKPILLTPRGSRNSCDVLPPPLLTILTFTLWFCFSLPSSPFTCFSGMSPVPLHRSLKDSPTCPLLSQ